MKKRAKALKRKVLKRKRKPVARQARGKRTIRELKAMADERFLSSEVQGWRAEARKWYRPVKRPITLRLDADVVSWFQAPGRGYQTRINRALRKVMMEERQGASKK